MAKKIDHKYLWSLWTTEQNNWSSLHRQYEQLHSFAFGMDDAQYNLADAGGDVVGTYNIIRSQVNQIVNPVTETPPEITTYPGDGADKQSAQALNGLLRHLQYKSCASNSYIHALRDMVTGGLGAWKLVLDKDEDAEDDDDTVIVDDGADGDVEPLVESLNPLQVFFDSASRRPDRKDARYCIVAMEMAKDDLSDLYANYKDDQSEVTELSDDADVNMDVVRFWEVYIRVKRNGKRAINRYVMTEKAIISTEEEAIAYPGKIIPVFLVNAPIIEHNNQKFLMPLTIDLMDVQKEINYWKSEMAALIGRAPKSQFFADKGSIEPGDEEAYQRSSTDPDAILYWNSHGGTKVKPEVIGAPELPNSYIQLAQANIQFAKDISGIRPEQEAATQQGMDSASGEALRQQRAMSNIAGYHFLDAWMFGLHQCGDCYIDLCIKTSNNNRIRVTMNGDKTTQLVSFGSEKVDRPDVKNFDLEQGNYGCTVTIGASYSSQKQELVGMIGDWSAKNEEVAKVTAGWLLRQSPVPGSDELGDLLDVVLLPPAAQQFLANKTTGDADQKLLQLTMKINEMSQQGQMQQKQLQLCEQHLQQASQEIEQLKSGDSVKLKLKQMDIDMLNTRIEHEERMRVLDNTTKKTIADQSNATRLETAAMGENTSLDKEELIHHHQANLKVLDHELDQAAQLGSQQFQTSEPTVNQ